MFDILVAAFVMLYLVPTADAYDRAHPHALRISLVNVFLGWTVVGWVAAFVWSRKISPVEFYAARNRPRRAVGMNARWAARLAVPRAEAGREFLRSARPSQTRMYGP
jgi:Superinfection immunity protein